MNLRNLVTVVLIWFQVSSLVQCRDEELKNKTKDKEEVTRDVLDQKSKLKDRDEMIRETTDQRFKTKEKEDVSRDTLDQRNKEKVTNKEREDTTRDPSLRVFTLSTKKVEKSNQSGPPQPSTIHNGDIAGRDEFPYIVAISNITRETFFYGAGVILNPRWILTAKHVAANGYLGDGIVVTPKYDNKRANLKEKLKYSVTDYFCPQHNIYADIALLKLKRDLPLDDERRRFDKIQLIKADQKLDIDENLTVAGWGWVNVTEDTKDPRKLYGTVANDLMKTDIQVKPDDDCAWYNWFSSPERFCTSGELNGACYGDSGGPVVVRGDGQMKDVLVGIVAAGGRKCSDTAQMMNVTYYRHWIDDIVHYENFSERCK